MRIAFVVFAVIVLAFTAWSGLQNIPTETYQSIGALTSAFLIVGAFVALIVSITHIHRLNMRVDELERKLQKKGKKQRQYID